MMMTTDTNTWRELLHQMQETSRENQSMLAEIREEMGKQKEKIRGEIEQMAAGLREQKADLQDLLEQMQNDPLLSMAEGDSISVLEKLLEEQLEKTGQVLDQTEKMLEGNGEVPALIDPARLGTRANREKNATYLPKLFRKEHILGNWVHYFSDNTFTCQAFWEDGSFKEYDFENNKLVGEREGTYEIDNSKIDLNYGADKNDQYRITGFTDQRIDYLIHGNNVQFDYMPESLLNQFLDAEAQ